MSNSQSLAEAVASYYLKILDYGEPHAENVRTGLRQTLLTATAKVLTEGRVEEIESSNRTMARLNAFLEGIILIIPMPEDSRYEEVADVKKITINSKADNHATMDMSLLSSALAGFSVHDSNTLNSSSGPRKQYPQIPSNALILRLVLYFRTLKRVAEVKKAILGGAEENTINSDGECVLHMEGTQQLKSHISLLVQAFVATAGCISSMRHILTNLLSHLTMQLLAVSTLSESLKNNIHDLVVAYEHLTCFASLAFLSTPKESAETKLAPLILKYLEYLSDEWKSCISSCQLELFLSLSLDAKLRSTFKTIEFQSISHLLTVCQCHKDSLENIQLIDVDHSTWPNNPGKAFNSRIYTDEFSMKQALRDLRREVITVNGRVLPPVTSLKDLVKSLKGILNSRTFKLKEHKIGNVHSPNDAGLEKDPAASTDDSSGTDSDSKRGSFTGTSNNYKYEGIKPNAVEALDSMTRRLIIAASRSEKGGDAYFVVRDLFGDETVDIVAVSQLSEPFLSWFRSGDLVPRGTIELLVRLSSVVIKVHACFNVYPKHQRGESDPLIQIHTTTTETIFLQEVRVDEHSRKIMLTEKHMLHSNARKILSIRPAKYEIGGNGYT